MPKDWKDITDDEILNFAGPQTADIARLDRILQKRSTDAVLQLRDKLTGLIETIYRASQGLEEKAKEVMNQYKSAADAQRRQQNMLLILSIVVAISTVTYTAITWQSVKAMREANTIQRQLLASHQPPKK